MLLILLQSRADSPPPAVESTTMPAPSGSGGWGGFNTPIIEPDDLYNEAEEIEMATIAALVVRTFQ